MDRDPWAAPDGAVGVILVEGTHDGHLLEALLAQQDVGGLAVLPAQGWTRFRDKLKALVNSDEFLTGIRTLGIVRDADSSADDAFASVIGALQGLGLPAPNKRGHIEHGDWVTPEGVQVGPVRVGVFIMPGGGSSSGQIEDLCLRSVTQHPAMECVGRLFDCLREKNIPLPKNESKARVHAFLATKPRPDKHLGTAAKEGYWEFTHEAFDELRAFLRALAEE